MPHLTRFRTWRAWLAAWLLACAFPAMAGLSVYTSWSTLPPVSAANQRSIDFSTSTLAGEGASRLTYTSSADTCPKLFGLCLLGTSSGGINLTSVVTGLLGFSGNTLGIDSGHNAGGSSAQTTINFVNPTPYVGFMWDAQFVSESTQLVNLTLEDNSIVTLKNCRSSANPQCVGAYVSPSWITDVYNVLLGWVLGDIVTTYPLYVMYQPSDGKKIKSVQFVSKECVGCGFLSSSTAQTTHIDYLTYVDASVVPHHLRVSANSNAKSANEDVGYTVTACGNADCSLPWTSGVTGTLTFSGASPTTASQGFSIPAGPTNSTTVTMQYTGSGTGTVAMSAYSPTPSNTPKVFCGMGSTPTSGGSCAITVTPPVDHFEVTTPASSGLTCETVTYTIKACSNAACSTVLTTGASGTLNLAGATPVSSAGFTTNASGIATVTVRTTTPGSVTASISGASPAAQNALRCGMGVSAGAGNSCAYTADQTKFKFDVPHHIGGVPQTVVVNALRSVENGARCAAAFATTEKSVMFTCTSTSHSSLTGSVALQGNGTGAAMGVCNGVAKSHTLKFDSNGQASMNLSYANAGETSIAASYTGTGAEAGLSMSGSDSFITVPKTLSMVATGPFVAGNAGVTSPATLTITALNNDDQVMTAFGNEISPAGVTVSLAGQSPTGADAKLAVMAAGPNQNVFLAMGSLASGLATGTLRWTEVGTLGLAATLNPGSVYSNSGLTVSGSIGAFGPFVPHHFDVEVTQACAASGKSPFTYSGQPFTAQVIARNTEGATTINHDGRSAMSAYFAKAVTLSGVSSTGSGGSLTGTAVLASDFAKGVATVTPTYAFTTKTTAPASITLSAAENSPGTVNSSAGSNGVVRVRSGRLFLSNAFGSGSTALNVPALFQYWSGSTWVLNGDDSCTTIPSGAVVFARYINNQGVASGTPWGSVSASGITASSGQGGISLSAPAAGSTGSIELAVNLGDTTTDSSCLTTHPAGGKAQRAWLRGPHGGACVGAGPFDPSARATIGVFAPESRRVMHSQDVY